MNKIYMPSHNDGGNRGCEAITRGTAAILKDMSHELIAYSNDIDLDKQLSILDVCKLRKLPNIDNESALFKLWLKVQKKLSNNLWKQKLCRYKKIYKNLLNNIDSRDIALSTGGDMLCYDNNEIIYINDYLYKKKIPNILWGCSIGEENLTAEKINTLNKFSLITARESLTKDLLENKLKLKTVKMFPDPAFVLFPQEIKLPDYFSNKECCGINLSNFVNQDVGYKTIFGKNIINCINYILDYTKLDVVLIPHVFWNGQDDRIICQNVYNQYKHTNRVHYLQSEKMNYCQIRYAISKCRFFMGARTHSVISAYSCSVPAIALGYSVKSVGIANDLQLDYKLVVNCKQLKTENELKDSFEYMMQTEMEIKDTYRKNLKKYIENAYGAKDALEEILEEQ